MRKPSMLPLGLFVSLLLVAGAARAQEAAPTAGGGGGRAAGLGLGVETTLTSGLGFGAGVGGSLVGPTGALFVYDAGRFRVHGLLGFASEENDDDIYALAGRFFFNLHQGTGSDFALGGGLAIVHFSNDGPGPDLTDIHLEGAAQLRAFLTPNVALSASLGLALVIPDEGNTVIAFGGQLAASFGMVYFFY